MDSIKVPLLDSTNFNVQYGLNWGQRENRDPNQAYLQLEPDVYKSDFFPRKGKYFIVKTDDNETLIFNRAQKQYGCALQTPENNAIIGKYIRKRLNIESGLEIKKEDILKYQKLDIDFYKIDDMNYTLSFPRNWKSNDIIYIYSQYITIFGNYPNQKSVQAKLSKLKEHLSTILSYGFSEFDVFDNPKIEEKLETSNKVAYHSDIEIVEYLNFLNSDFFLAHYTFPDSSSAPSALSTSYLTAMRTKPFLLLAGISGTGKSRIVKQMAFESCPDKDDLRHDPTSPGNYELIEVKPNWHDSSELLGYESEIGGPHYVVTPFVRFLVKAMRYPDVPFFVCMDEMNLAPVEQYFAEFLSVLESRKLLSDGTITSEPLIKADIFSKYADQLHRDLDITDTETYKAVYDRLKNDGLRLRLPSNLIVVGTVNMDETTHQFSRKVIDRAMTIEMNIEDAETPFKNFFEGGDALHYYDNPQPKELFLPKVVQASEALSILSAEDASYLKENVPGLLHSLNSALNGTPFKIAYRVQNELILYFFSLREENPDEAAEALLAQAMDAILMMKVLPRIEGDEDLLDKPLKALAQFTENYPQASRKIAEMQERLPQAHFTCFWP